MNYYKLLNLNKVKLMVLFFLFIIIIINYKFFLKIYNLIENYLIKNTQNKYSKSNQKFLDFNIHFNFSSPIEFIRTELLKLIESDRSEFIFPYKVIKDDYSKWLSLLGELDENIKLFEKTRKKVLFNFNQYDSNKNLSWGKKEFLENSLENLLHIFGSKKDDLIKLSPFLEEVQIEFNKCLFNLKGSPLRLISTEKYHMLINQYGFILVELHDPSYHNLVYEMTLTIPIELIDYFEFNTNDSKFELGINYNYYRKNLESIDRIEDFKKLIKILSVFNNSKYKKSINNESFIYQVIKENNNIEITDLVNFMVETETISLNEYLINVELGNIEYDMEFVFHLIFDKQYIGSFYSKKKDKITITETSKKVFSIDELKNFYLLSFSNKVDFYTKIGLDKYLDNINLSLLNEPKIYRSVFGFSYSYYDGRDTFIKNELLKNIKYPELLELIEKEIRKTENQIRLQKGYTIVGTLMNENILYKKLVDYFPNETIISQGKPKWLGKQSLDIYFPIYNIGIEYQGEQHFKPVDYFGGVEKFEKQLILDNKKRELCKKNKCVLFEVSEGYSFEDLVIKIEEVLLLY